MTKQILDNISEVVRTKTYSAVLFLLVVLLHVYAIGVAGWTIYEHRDDLTKDLVISASVTLVVVALMALLVLNHFVLRRKGFCEFWDIPKFGLALAVVASIVALAWLLIDRNEKNTNEYNTGIALAAWVVLILIGTVVGQLRGLEYLCAIPSTK